MEGGGIEWRVRVRLRFRVRVRVKVRVVRVSLRVTEKGMPGRLRLSFCFVILVHTP